VIRLLLGLGVLAAIVGAVVWWTRREEAENLPTPIPDPDSPPEPTPEPDPASTA
jgi:hypothetical protein